MIKGLKWTLVLLLFAVLTFVSAKPSLAFELGGTDQSSGNLSLSQGVSVNDNYFAFGNLINLNGNINGDLITAGNQLEINGEVDNNVFAAGSTVIVKGKVKRDVFIGAADVTIDKDAIIEGDLSVGANNLVVNGEIKGLVRAGVNTLNVNGKIGNGINASVENFMLGENANVSGDISYTSANGAKINSNSKITGKIEQKSISPKAQKESTSQKAGTMLISLLSALLVGVVLLSIMPKKSAEIYSLIKTKFWPSVGIGFLALIVIPIIVIALLVIFIGIPLALISLALYIFAIYATKIFVGLALGQLISGEKWAPIWAMTLGVFILSVIAMIPVLGGIISFAVVLVGLGAIALLFTKKSN